MTAAPTLETLELRDDVDVARWLAGGFQCQRPVNRTPETLARLLAVLVRLSSEGEPTPPAGVVVDLLRFVDSDDGRTFARESGLGATRSGLLPPEVARRHEDQVLGRLALDDAFQRAAAAAGRCRGDERVATRAFLVDAFRRAVGAPGVRLSAAVVRRFAAQPAAALAREWAAMPIPADVVARLVDSYERLRVATRSTSRLIAAEDLFELERGLATRPFASRLALRQLLQAADLLSESLPSLPPRQPTKGDRAPYPSFEEDQFPTGGYASISTRGSVESLLHSQLAFMERGERPDLFDARFVRDELLYYARDENQHFRPRRAIFLLFVTDLAAARVKDAEAPFQRVVLALGAVVAAIRVWRRWLTDESLRIELVLPPDENHDPLAPERELLEQALVLEREAGVVAVQTWQDARLRAEVQAASQRSLRRGLRLSTTSANTLTIHELRIHGLTFDDFAVAGSTPRFHPRGDRAGELSDRDVDPHLKQSTDELIDSWRMVVERMATAVL